VRVVRAGGEAVPLCGTCLYATDTKTSHLVPALRTFLRGVSVGWRDEGALGRGRICCTLHTAN